MKDVAKFIFEIGTLKRIKRTWFKNEGVPEPESVADHNYRATVLGYILAKMEGADENKVIKMCAFHETAEARIGDLDKIAQHYINKDEAEMRAIEDQMKTLPASIRDEMLPLMREFFERKTKEAIIARDTDVLELLFQAKEYAEAGHHGCFYWIERNEKLLKTDSAKKLFAEMKNMNPTEWWKGLENLR
jgi:putative hydrolase of HD superfamily